MHRHSYGVYGQPFPLRDRELLHHAKQDGHAGVSRTHCYPLKLLHNRTEIGVRILQVFPPGLRSRVQASGNAHSREQMFGSHLFFASAGFIRAHAIRGSLTKRHHCQSWYAEHNVSLRYPIPRLHHWRLLELALDRLLQCCEVEQLATIHVTDLGFPS